MMDELEQNEAELLAAEYALGLLSPQEAKAFETLMAQDASFRVDYARWAEDFAAITDDIGEASPSADLLDRINAELGPVSAAKAVADTVAAAEIAEPEAPAPVVTPPEPEVATHDRVPWWQRLGFLPPVAGGLVAAMAVLWLINLSGVFTPPVPGGQVTLAAADNSIVVEVFYADDGKSLTFDRTAGEIPEGQSLELWLLREGRDPVSLGTLPEDTTTGTIEVTYNMRFGLRGASCAISIEPPGGSPTGAPSGEVVATAPIVWS